MSRRATFQICAVLAAACSLVTCHINDIYVDWTNSEGWQNKITSTWTAIVKLYEDTNEALPEFLPRIGQVPIPESLSLPARSLYVDFIRLADTNVECFGSLTNRVMELCAISNSLEPVQLREALANFMNQNARTKFENCLPLVLGPLLNDRNNDYLSAERMLDDFFGVHYYEESTKYDFLRALDLKSSRSFQIRRAIHVALHYKHPMGEEIKIFYSFMRLICTNLRKGREYEFNIVSLAKTFGCSLNGLPARIFKFLEYNRLCASLTRPDTSERVELNLISLLRE